MNKITISGLVCSEVEYYYEYYGEKFYTFFICSKRKSGVADYIPCVVPDDLLERINEETTTAGGIIIPDNAREKPSRGRVIATGAGTQVADTLIPMTVKKDDVVLFAKWAASANEIKLEGRDYILIKETDILGIIE